MKSSKLLTFSRRLKSSVLSLKNFVQQKRKERRDKNRRNRHKDRTRGRFLDGLRLDDLSLTLSKSNTEERPMSRTISFVTTSPSSTGLKMQFRFSTRHSKAFITVTLPLRLTPNSTNFSKTDTLTAPSKASTSSPGS
jgi:hypothetical protein